MVPPGSAGAAPTAATGPTSNGSWPAATWAADGPATAVWTSGGAAAGAPAALANTIHVNWLLEFQDRGLEASYQRYLRCMHLRVDLCIFAVNVFVVMTALVQQQRGRVPFATAAPPAAAVLGVLSAAQSLALLALMLRSPRCYTAWRAALIGATRLYRLAVWALYLPRPRPASGAWELLSVRLFLLSPAGGSLWFTLVFPLPLPLHMGLLAVTALVAGWRGGALCDDLAGMPGVGRQALAAHARLNALSRLLELPAHKLLPEALLQPADEGPTTAVDATTCVYAFVVVLYGLLLPLLLLYMKEVHLRSRFLSLLAPSISQQQLTGARSQLYSITLSVAFLAVSLVPCAWTALQLLPGALRGGGGGPAAAGVVAGVLLLDVFMRFWMLSAASFAFNVSVLPRLRRVADRAAMLLRLGVPALGGGQHEHQH